MVEYDQQITKALAGNSQTFAACPRNRWRRVLRIVGVNLLAMVIIMVIWQLVALWIGHSRGVTFPSPLQTWTRLLTFFVGGEGLYGQSIYQHLLASLGRWATGYLVAVFVGIMIGLLLGGSASLNEICMPVFHVLQLIPGLAWPGSPLPCCSLAWETPPPYS